MAKFRVTTPVEGYTGESVGVFFKDGEAVVEDPAALAYFRTAGYGIEPAGKHEAPEPDAKPAASRSRARKN